MSFSAETTKATVKHQAIKGARQEIPPQPGSGRAARFFIEFLTEPGDVVLDPFAGSNPPAQFTRIRAQVDCGREEPNLR